MFNVEPQEKWDAEEIEDFETHVAAILKRTKKDATYAGMALLINILGIIPFLKGHSLHRYWETIGKYLDLTAMALLLWFVIKVGFIWSAWQSARETRREFGDPK